MNIYIFNLRLKFHLLKLENKQSNTPLHIASGIDYLPNNNIVKILIKHGAEINEESEIGEAPLHFACENEYLIERGADIN